MGANMVIRTPNYGEAVREYRTQTGEWSRDPDDAFHTSEEDAKAIVRTLRQADRAPALYEYEEKPVAQ